MRNHKGFLDALDDRIFRLWRNAEFGGNSIVVERATRGGYLFIVILGA